MARRKLSGLRCIVTGASSGIGRELVRQLVAQGAKVVGVARRLDRLKQLADELPADQFVPHCGDITDPFTRSMSLVVCVEAFGGLDLLINNAGLGGLGPFADADEARLRQIFEVNLFAPAELTRAALPMLRAGRTPAIVNVSSVLGHRAVPGKSEYCASKFALHGWSDALRAELAAEGIDVILVSPSTTSSEFFDVAVGRDAKPPGIKSSPMPSAAVARIALRAIERGQNEVILTWGAKSLVWLDRLCPPLANWIVAKWG